MTACLSAGLREYHDAVIRPESERIQAAVDADRAARSRAVLEGGIVALFDSFVAC